MTEKYHRGCGNHVKNQLCGSAGLHAGASGDEFGSHDCYNRNLGSQGKRRVRIAGDTGGEKTIIAGGRHSTDHIRGGSRGSYADNRVLTCRGKGLNVLPALLRIVLGTFDSLSNGSVTSCDEADYKIERCAESGRDFRGVHNSEATAGAGTYVEEPAALLHSFHNAVHKHPYFRDCLPDGLRDTAVLIVDAFKKLLCGHRVQTVVI